MELERLPWHVFALIMNGLGLRSGHSLASVSKSMRRLRDQHPLPVYVQIILYRSRCPSGIALLTEDLVLQRLEDEKHCSLLAAIAIRVGSYHRVSAAILRDALTTYFHRPVSMTVQQCCHDGDELPWDLVSFVKLQPTHLSWNLTESLTLIPAYSSLGTADLLPTDALLVSHYKSIRLNAVSDSRDLVGPFLANMHSLEKLTLHTDWCCAEQITCLRFLPHLRQLKLHSGPLHHTVLEMLPQLTQVTHLCVNLDIDFADVASQAHLTRMLRVMPQLETLKTVRSASWDAFSPPTGLLPRLRRLHIVVSEDRELDGQLENEACRQFHAAVHAVARRLPTVRRLRVDVRYTGLQHADTSALKNRMNALYPHIRVMVVWYSY